MRQASNVVGAMVLFIAAGCVTLDDLTDRLALVPTRPVEAPATLIPDMEAHQATENPVFIPLGPESYGKVFESVLEVLAGYGFEILDSNRYDGRIETIPRISPGVILFLKPGSPVFRERILSTLQTYRHRVSVVIQPADNGGFFLEVIARKELQDLPRPMKQTAGAAIFRTDNSVERQFEVIDPTVYEVSWIFKGRDPALEQKIIQKLKCLM